MAGGSVLDFIGLILLVLIIAAVLGLIVYSKFMRVSHLISNVENALYYANWQDINNGKIYRVESSTGTLLSAKPETMTKRFYSRRAYNSWGRPRTVPKPHELLESIKSGPDVEPRMYY